MPTAISTTPARTWSNCLVASPSAEPAAKIVIFTRPPLFSSIDFAQGSSPIVWMKCVGGNMCDSLSSNSAAAAQEPGNTATANPSKYDLNFMTSSLPFFLQASLGRTSE